MKCLNCMFDLLIYTFQGALLVNIARGGLIDYKYVAHHLESGHLGGLGIDVAWTEPFDPDDPILKLKNVIITPHVGGVTEYSYRSMAKVWLFCIPACLDWYKIYFYHVQMALELDGYLEGKKRKKKRNDNLKSNLCLLIVQWQIVGDVALQLHAGLPLSGIEFVN